jgi:aryl-alcohol dehydrogenase-like predicted oxidoreductase
MSLTRRRFFETATAASLLAPAALASAQAPALAPPLPRRPFGRAGFDVPILGFGSGSRFLMYEQEDEALAALEAAIAEGITYIDTAHSYGDGKSEERIGRLMPARRGEVVLATKIPGRTADAARRQVELSLRRLQTDRLDVLHIHALRDEDDLKAIEAPDGVLQALYKLRDEKVARAIGITCHASPTALKLALERHDLDATQMALNAGLARMADTPRGLQATRMPQGGFEELALPVAVEKRLGIIAMKVFGQEQLLGAAPIETLLRYALSLPVSLASLGMPRRGFITANAAQARDFRPLTDAERRALSESISTERKAAMRVFFRDHRDA